MSASSKAELIAGARVRIIGPPHGTRRAAEMPFTPRTGTVIREGTSANGGWYEIQLDNEPRVVRSRRGALRPLWAAASGPYEDELAEFRRPEKRGDSGYSRAPSREASPVLPLSPSFNQAASPLVAGSFSARPTQPMRRGSAESGPTRSRTSDDFEDELASGDEGEPATSPEFDARSGPDLPALSPRLGPAAVYDKRSSSFEPVPLDFRSSGSAGQRAHRRKKRPFRAVQSAFDEPCFSFVGRFCQ
jgi:hypothetical protein